jgi:hypothetical protein
VALRSHSVAALLTRISEMAPLSRNQRQTIGRYGWDSTLTVFSNVV